MNDKNEILSSVNNLTPSGLKKKGREKGKEEGGMRESGQADGGQTPSAYDYMSPQ